MKANRSHLVEKVMKELKCSRAMAERAVNSVFKGTKELIKKSKGARFVGFGSFVVRERKARMGRNPQTGKPLKIKASKTVRFVPSAELKKGL